MNISNKYLLITILVMGIFCLGVSAFKTFSIDSYIKNKLSIGNVIEGLREENSQHDIEWNQWLKQWTKDRTK